MTQYLSLDVLFFFQTNSPVEELEEVINLLIEGVKIKQCLSCFDWPFFDKLLFPEILVYVFGGLAV